MEDIKGNLGNYISTKRRKCNFPFNIGGEEHEFCIQETEDFLERQNFLYDT